MKQLSRLFPNKVTVQLPQVLFLHSVYNLVKLFSFSSTLECLSQHFWASWQDEALLVDWKQQLERDIETLKAQANIFSFRSVSVIASVLWTVMSTFLLIFLRPKWRSLLSCKDFLKYMYSSQPLCSWNSIILTHGIQTHTDASMLRIKHCLL